MPDHYGFAIQIFVAPCDDAVALRVDCDDAAAGRYALAALLAYGIERQSGVPAHDIAVDIYDVALGEAGRVAPYEVGVSFAAQKTDAHALALVLEVAAYVALVHVAHNGDGASERALRKSPEII